MAARSLFISHHNEGLRKFVSLRPEEWTETGFAASFGFPIGELHLKVQRYFRANKLRVARMAPLDAEYEVRVTDMATEERDYLLAHMGVGSLSTERMRQLFDDTKELGLSHLAYAEHLMFVEDNIAEAEALVDRLLSQRPNEPRVLVMKARTLMRKRGPHESPPAVRKRVAEATRLALKANRLDPKSIDAFQLVAEAGLWMNQVKASDIELAIMSARNLAPYRDDLMLLHLRYLSRFGRPEEARNMGALLLNRTENARIRKLVRSVLATL